MGNFNYARAQQTSTRLLKKFGKPVQAILLKPGTKSGDEFNPSEGAPTKFKCWAVELNYGQRDIDGQRILSTDKRIYVSTETLNNEIPTTAWQLQVGTVIYKIAGLGPDTLKPADVLVLGDLQCRLA